MGNWFSSEPKRQAPTPYRSPSYYAESSYTAPPQRPPPPRTTTTTYSQNAQYNYYGGSSHSTAQRTAAPQPKTNISNRRLTSAVYSTADAQNWHTTLTGALGKYTLVQLNEESTDYQRVYQLFRSTAQKQLKVQKIHRVENPYLFGSYILKREELNSRSGNLTQENNYFHGTKSKNVAAICSNNFNWRLHGDSLGNRFGKGISFSPISNYSSHYCDNNPYSENTMFLARVLVTNSIAVGSKNMIIPPNGYDTAGKKDGHVVVKFCDDEFYPEFIIYYTGSAVKTQKPKAEYCG